MTRQAGPRVLNIAHRGASGHHPENTLAAIRGALRLGVDSIELDVQRSRDGALVLVHDTTLARTTDARRLYPRRAPWNVADFDHDELMRLDAGGWKGPTWAGEQVPTLQQALVMAGRGGTGLLLELKAPTLYPGIVGDVVAALRDTPSGTVVAPPVVVQSFDVAAMQALKVRAPEVAVGVLGAPARSELPSLAAWADQVNPHHWSVDRSYVDAVHEHGMECFAWTVNRTYAMRRSLDLGVDGIITNEPLRLSAALERRGDQRGASRWSSRLLG